MNLSQMRALVRRDLHDEDAANYRWSDDELDRHITRAVRELSLAAPLEGKAVLTTTADSRDLSLASLADRVSSRRWSIRSGSIRLPTCPSASGATR